MRQLHSHFIKLNRAREAKNAADILIATDHSALVEVIQHHGGRAVITGVTFQHLVTKWPIQYDRFDIFKISPCRCRLPIGNRSCPSALAYAARGARGIQATVSGDDGGQERHGIVVMLHADEAMVSPAHIDLLIDHLRARSFVCTF